MNDERQPAALIQRVKEETLKRIREDRKGAPDDVAEILEAIEKGIFGPGFDLSDVRRECAGSGGGRARRPTSGAPHGGGPGHRRRRRRSR